MLLLKKIFPFAIFIFSLSIVGTIGYSAYNFKSLMSPEIKVNSTSFFGKFGSKSVAASCGFSGGSSGTGVGHSHEYTSCTMSNGCPGFSQCGGNCSTPPATMSAGCSNGGGSLQPTACSCPSGYTLSGTTCNLTMPTCNGCPNQAIDPPTCSLCASGANMVNGQCICGNGASNAANGCNICPSGQVMQNNLCVCANGATNPTACNTCPAGSNMVNGMCTCNNGADVFQQCNACKTGQAFDGNGQCKDGCTTTNACGQTITGFMNNGTCSLVGVQNPNESCILNFDVTTNTVNPNGSVEFSWSLANLPSSIRSRCGFVDLTTPTPRPIPGLQNLDPKTDRVRINNVQATTRFCLVCQFYNLLQNNALLGEAVKHQWVRVIKVGEN